jgi:cytochrome c-type biogenesis protein CcmH/NrfF
MIKKRRTIAALILLAAASVPLLCRAAETQRSDRAKQLGKRLMCTCGSCTESAGLCSHPGSSFSGPCEGAQGILKEIDLSVARGDSDEMILKAFEKKYGPAVLAEPPNKGFNRVAWLLPGMTLAAGMVLVVFVVSRWRRPAAGMQSAPGPGANPSREWLEQAKLRADRETED